MIRTAKRHEDPMLKGAEPAPRMRQFGFIDIACVGLDNEASLCTAVVRIRRPSTDLCGLPVIYYVGFWLRDERGANKRLYVGSQQLRVSNWRNNPNQIDAVHYSVSLELDPSLVKALARCEESAPYSHLEVAIYKLHYLFALSSEVRIQLPRRSYFGRSNLLADSPGVFPVYASHLPNGTILLFGGSLGGVALTPKTQIAGKGGVILHGNSRGTDFSTKRVATFHPRFDSFQAAESPSFQTNDSKTYTATVTRDGKEVEETQRIYVAQEAHNVFGAGVCVLPDGQPLAVGGLDVMGPADDRDHSFGVRQVSAYDVTTDHWTRLSQPIQRARFGAGCLTLGDGRVFIMDGHASVEDLGRNEHLNLDLEILEPQTWQWERGSSGGGSVVDELSGRPQFYPRLHLLPDGSVLCASTLQTVPSNPSSVGRINRWIPAVGDPQRLGSWQPLALPASFPQIDMNDTSVMLPLRYDFNGGKIEYDPQATEVLVLKEHRYFSIRPLAIPPLGAVVRLYKQRRYNATSLILADGSILFLGGTSQKYSDADALLQTDLFDPSSRTWSSGPTLKRPRNLYSSAILLKDGRVLVGGSKKDGLIDPMKQTEGSDLTYEVLEADYLWRGPRPRFGVSPSKVARGSYLTVKLASGWNFGMLASDKIGLIRCHAVTHGFGYDQRYVSVCPVDISSQYWKAGNPELKAPTDDAAEFLLWIPGDGNIVPPGYYMLFLVSAMKGGLSGTPSEAAIIQIT